MIRHALGVYVVGAIEPADRAKVDEHLASCHDCREELAGLAALPALLGRVPEAEVALPAPDDRGGDGDLPAGTALPRLLGRAAGIRRARRRRRIAAAAATLLIGAGGGIAAQRALHPAGPASSPSSPSSASSLSSPSSQAAWTTVSARDRVTLASATVRYAPMAWGTRLAVTVGGIAPGTPCQLRVISSRGQEAAAGAWTMASSHLGAWYAGSASFPASSLRAFQVTAGGRILVTVPAR